MAQPGLVVSPPGFDGPGGAPIPSAGSGQALAFPLQGLTGVGKQANDPHPVAGLRLNPSFEGEQTKSLPP